MKMRCEGASFLHLYNEVWRRAGIPTYLGPPAGSYLDWLLAKHLPEVRFAAALQLEHIAAWLRNSDRSIACDHLELKYQALLSANNPLSALPLDPKSLSIRRTVDHDMLRQMTNEGRYEVALRLALEARNRDINDAEAHFRIGQCLFSDGGDADQGIAALDAAEQLGFAERFWLLFFRGALYARQGKTESALKDLNEAVSLDPTHVEAANLRRAMHQVQQQSGG
jgi:tetratricopeptide (TPR) repeat protein